jgi:glycosyltransferase involved in cell wall biosynthesis
MNTSCSPLVTIAIPTYNRAGVFLRQALESALAQTYEPLEIIVADNCSTDQTPILMQDYASDKRVRYVRHKNNLGPHRNFNFCLDAAKGSFFLMLHDDDKIDQDFVEACIAALDQKEDVGYVRTGVRLIDSNGKVTERYPNYAVGTSGSEAVLKWIRCRNFWTLSSTLYEADALRDIGGFSEKEFPLTCDCHATVKIALLQHRGVEIKPVKASFRRHEESITNRLAVNDWVDEWSRLYRRVIELAPSLTARRHFKNEGAEFFSMLAYNHVENLTARRDRYLSYALVYSKFGGKYFPPPVRKRLRILKKRILG